MEHRWKKRYPLSQDVIVRCGNSLTLHGRIRDISLDGMFIQLVPDVVSTSMLVEVEISRCGSLHGLVIHVENEGIGVMFRSLGRKEKHLLGLLLAEEAPQQES